MTRSRRARHRFVRFHPLALAATCALNAAPAAAATVTWIGANNGFWHVASNWDLGLPGAADDAVLGVFDTGISTGTFGI